LLNKNGKYNLNRFINTFDYSLDLIQLREIYYKKYRRKDFGFWIQKKEYSFQVINVTFKYANKDFNQIRKDVYVKFGYDLSDLKFDNCIALNTNGEVVGIQLNTLLSKENNAELPEYFILEDNQYKLYSTPKTLKSRAELRTELYRNGFYCDGIHYVRFKRSAGSARVGKCLFINEDLYKMMHKWELCGINVKNGQEIDLAALESYIALPTSSIIDTVNIDLNSILVIDDYESNFEEEVVATSIENGTLRSEQKVAKISNSIWDGQSLLDKSVFGKYDKYGMILLRNRHFKSCCFNCNIQQWFQDNSITEISQLHGFTLAKDISQIKMITTPSSIKYLKFGTLEQWFSNIDSIFGVVKHDKPTHYFDGKLVQTHYQLINTLELSFEEVEKFLKPSLDFAKDLRDKPEVVKYFIKYPNNMSFDNTTIHSKNDVVYQLMCINNNFTKTKYYRDFVNELIKSYYKNLKRGHILVHGNYSTLLGNPIEMLLAAIGQFDGESQIGLGNIHSTRFDYGKELLGSRSPHVAAGNVLVAKNTENQLIDKYCNLTNEIVCINSIKENILQRLSGCDFDSDTILLTDNNILLSAAKRNYHIFKTPTSFVSARKTKRYYTPEQQSDLDIKTSVNKIGEIVNLSQILNSLYWDNIAHGMSHSDNHELYCDIATLDVLSGVEIDSAKKEFDISTTKELSKIKNKYKSQLTDDISGQKIVPHFFAHIDRQKGYYNSTHKNYSKHCTSMDYLQTVVNSFKLKNRLQKDYLPFSVILDNTHFAKWGVNKEQIKRIHGEIMKYKQLVKQLFYDSYDKQSRYEIYQIYKTRLINTINQERIGYSTMFELLNSLEYKENMPIKNILLEILCFTNNDSFRKAIIQSISPISFLEMDNNIINNNYTLFGIKFKKLQKSAKFFEKTEK